MKMLKPPVLILLFSVSVFGVQSQNLDRKQGDLTIGMTFSQVTIETFDVRRPIGVFYEYMSTRRVGVQGGFAATKNYFEFGTGTICQLIMAPYTVGKAKVTSGSIAFGILLLGSLEHTNLHIPLAKKIELTPYLSLLRVRYYWQPDSPYSTNIFPSAAVGLKLQVALAKEWELIPFIEGTHIYNTDRLKGWQLGVNFARPNHKLGNR